MAERSPATEPRGLENLWHKEALRLRPKLTSVARRVVRNRAEAEEIADEAIARLVRKARGEGLPDEIAGWLHRTALRLAIDQARHWVRRQRPGWLHTVGRRTGVLSAEEELERRETGDRVWRTILELPRRQQEVIVLHEMEGLPYAEVGALLEIEESTARAHAHAAREELRRKLR